MAVPVIHPETGERYTRELLIGMRDAAIAGLFNIDMTLATQDGDSLMVIPSNNPEIKVPQTRSELLLMREVIQRGIFDIDMTLEFMEESY